ncbi:MAG: hypothetical protein IPL08_14215 [Saprospiraceae bacterium]|nr:hypothetical protein [Saprospiraceae bacterium]
MGKKALIWFCKRSALNPSTFVLGIVLDYTAEALINYWFDNDAGNDFLLTFYNVVKSRGITGFAISVGQQVVNSPVGYFIGTFLNCIITGKDPLTAVATAALNTAFQAALKGVSKSSPLIKKYIKGLTDEALENPGLIVKIILESNTRTRWKLKTKWLNDIDGTSGTFKKGNWGEIVGDLHLIGRGYERISSRVVQTLDDPLRKGIDGVFKKVANILLLNINITNQL